MRLKSRCRTMNTAATAIDSRPMKIMISRANSASAPARQIW